MNNINETPEVKIQEQLEEAKLSTIATEIKEEHKELVDIENKLPEIPDSEKKEELTVYVEKLKTKLNWIMDAMTEEKIKRANLAQLAKAIRTLSNEATNAIGGKVKRSENKDVKVILNVENMTTEELLNFLGKKSQER